MPDPLVARVVEIIAQTQYLPSEKITAESTFADLGIDSLNGLAIVAELERVFDISIPNEQALLIRDVPQTVECLRALLPPTPSQSV